jgi:hypothetical protein
VSGKRSDKGRLPPFVPLLKETLTSPAWRAMSHGARSLYVALKLRFSNNFKNNGKIYLSQRNAARELGSGFEEITNWFRELQHYGFIVQTQAGCLGVNGKGLAPHWRLTECGYMAELPTRNFLKWDGTKFKRHRRAGRDGKRNPAPPRRSTPLRKGGAPLLRKGGAPPTESDTERRCIQDATPATERRCITSNTTPQRCWALSPGLPDLMTEYSGMGEQRYELEPATWAMRATSSRRQPPPNP